MISQMAGHPESLDQLDRRSVDNDCAIEYYTLQPAPTQWVAVGRPTSPAGPRFLLVGAGSTEIAAVENLRERCRQRRPAAVVLIRHAPGEQYA